jgi:hypothetical protein
MCEDHTPEVALAWGILDVQCMIEALAWGIIDGEREGERQLRRHWLVMAIALAAAVGFRLDTARLRFSSGTKPVCALAQIYRTCDETSEALACGILNMR